MKMDEKRALLHYIEFQLLTFCKAIEKDQQDPQIIEKIYNHAYGILIDLDESIILEDHPLIKK